MSTEKNAQGSSVIMSGAKSGETADRMDTSETQRVPSNRKRSRRKVDKSADFLYTGTKSQEMDLSESVPSRPKRRQSSSVSKSSHPSIKPSIPPPVEIPATGPPAVVVPETAEEVQKLIQRKDELLAYREELLAALAIKRREVAASLHYETREASELEQYAGKSGSKRKSGISAGSQAAGTGGKKRPPKKRPSLSGVGSRGSSVSIYDDGPVGHLPTTVPFEEMKKSCLRILNDLMKHRDGFIFSEPVDPVALGIPDYLDIIKQPMDLGTIKSRIDSGHYQDIASIKSDVSLVWSNAKLYNAPSSQVHRAACGLETVADRKFVALTRERRLSTARSLMDVDTEEDQANGYPGEGRGLKQRSRSRPSTEKELTPREKEELRDKIASLRPDQHLPIVELLQSKSEDGPSSGEVVIELGKLDTSTLRQLQRLVTKIISKTKSKPSGKSSVARKKSKTISKGATAGPNPPASYNATMESSDLSDGAASDSSSSSAFFSESSAEENAMPHPLAAAQATTGPNGAASRLVHQPSVGSTATADADQVKEHAASVSLENPEAWTSLSRSASGVPSTKESNARDTVEEQIADSTWSEFQSKDHEIRQKEKALAERLEKQRRLQAEQEEELRQAEMRRRAQEEEEEKARKAAKEAEEKEKQLKLDQEREAARREREQEDEFDDQAGAVEEFENLMSA